VLLDSVCCNGSSAKVNDEHVYKSWKSPDLQDPHRARLPVTLLTSPCLPDTLELNSSELILIRDALTMLIQHCAEEIARGSEEPFHFCQTEAEKLFERLGGSSASPLSRPRPIDF
jgi:hypothetical protein